MIPRLWICTEQPLPVHALAAPLHPLFILLSIALAAWWMLIGRLQGARLVFRLAGASAFALCALTLLFAAMAFALLATGLDPSAVLVFTPTAWALGGALVVGWVGMHVRRIGLQQVRAQLGIPEFGGERKAGCLWWMGLLSALSISGVIAARYWITDEGGDRNVLNIPYRLLEWGVVDRIDGPVSNECLAMRIIEYADYDANGKQAIDTLYARGRSAIPGVVSKLDNLREHWPPAPHTVTRSGIITLLNFLRRQGELETGQQWSKIDYDHDLENIEPSSRRFILRGMP